MGRIPDSVKQDILARTDIVSLVRETVQLRKSGASFVGLCPFHAEKTPSFHVHPGRQIFHCFGCGRGGDAFAFVMERDGLTFPEAVRVLGERVGVVVEETTPEQDEAERRRRDQRDWLLRVNELACRFWEQALWSREGEAARRYLDGRGITRETAESHRLGYAVDSWQGLVEHLRSHRVPDRIILDAGLARMGRKGPYDWFRGRIVTPVMDLHGRVIGFSGRILDPDASPAKYVNSPETILFRKGASLFGLHLAKQAMRESGAIIVEGNFDLLRLHQEGFWSAVAPMGTALTGEQVSMVRRFTDRVWLCYDGDQAGRKAALAAVEVVLEQELDARVILLPDGEDPDSFLARHGAEGFRKAMAGALPIIEALLRSKAPPPGAPVEARVKAFDALLPVLKRIRNPMTRDHYLTRTAQLLRLDERRIREYMTRPVRRQADGHVGLDRTRAGADQSGRLLLEFLVDHPEEVPRVARMDDVLDVLPEHPAKEALMLLFRLAEEEGPPTAARLLAELPADSPLRSYVQTILARPVLGGSPPAGTLDDILRNLRRRKLAREPATLKEELRLARERGDEARVKELLARRLSLAREKEDLNPAR